MTFSLDLSVAQSAYAIGLYIEEELVAHGYLNPTVGTATTPDPGPLPNECTFVFRVRGPSANGVLVGQWETAGQLAFFLSRYFSADRWNITVSADGTAPAARSTPLGVPAPGSDAYGAITYVGNNGSNQATIRSWTSTDGVTWVANDPSSYTSIAHFDSSTVLRLGSRGTEVWNDRIYWAELRTGLDPTAGGEALAVPGHIYLPGTASNYLSTPNSAAFNPTAGDLTVIARIAPDDWTPAALNTVVARWSPNQYLLYLNTNGTLYSFWNETGGATKSHVSTVAVPGVTDGGWKWVAWTLDVDNGASGHTSRYWWSDDGNTWTQVGADVTGAGVSSVTATAGSAIQLGMVSVGTNPFKGKLSYVSIRNGIGAGGVPGGTEVFRFNAGADLAPSLSADATSFTASTGQTMTVNRSASDPKTTLVPTTAGVVWRFDADDYPGTGTSYTDPRGRTWTLTAETAITPKIEPSSTKVAAQRTVDFVHWSLVRGDEDYGRSIGLDPVTHTRQWYDAEAPFGVALHYRLADEFGQGLTDPEGPVTLNAPPLAAMVHAVSDPGVMTQVVLVSQPGHERDQERGVFYAVGRASPIVQYGVQRARTGTIVFDAPDDVTLEALEDLFATPSPLAVRARGLPTLVLAPTSALRATRLEDHYRSGWDLGFDYAEVPEAFAEATSIASSWSTVVTRYRDWVETVANNPTWDALVSSNLRDWRGHV